MSVKHVNHRRVSRPARRPRSVERACRQYEHYLRAELLARAERDEKRRGPVASYCADVAQEAERARYRAAQESAVLNATLDTCDECRVFGPVVEDVGQPVCLACAERARYGDSLEPKPAEYWWEQARRADADAAFAEENAETFPQERQRF